MKRWWKRLVRRSPLFRPLRRVVKRFQIDPDLLFVTPGHFYSPIPSRQDRQRFEQERSQEWPRHLPDVELNEAAQLALLDEFVRYYPEQPWSLHRQEGLRYFLDNAAYSSFDGIIYYCMLRHFRPRRVIEVGSGYSSCAFLDVNERFCGQALSLTCIEPYPRSLLKRITPADRTRIELLARPLQEVPVERFRALQAGDVLFIDSSHVAKLASDVNYLFAQILPGLAAGVQVHFHDVFYPFEYPAAWVEQGRAWNEAYLLRAFLQYNQRFRIEFFNSYLAHFHQERLLREMPLCLCPLASCAGVPSGSSLWLRVGT
jgi:hypothetical protein